MNNPTTLSPVGSRNHLQIIKRHDRNLNPRLEELSSGKKARNAINAAALNLAQNLLGGAGALEREVMPDISMGQSSIDAANVGIDGIQSMIYHMEGLAQMSHSSSDPKQRQLYAEQYDMIRQQATNLAYDASFGGDNVVINKNDYQMGVNFTKGGSSAIGVDPIFRGDKLTLVDEHTGDRYTVSDDGKFISGTNKVKVEVPDDSIDPKTGSIEVTESSVTTTKPPDSMDIVFVVDTTGSMGGDIRDVREGIDSFVQGLNDSPNIDSWRAKIVGYKDYNVEGGTYYKDAPFVSSTGDLESQLNTLLSSVRGGGDTPESLADSVQQVLETTDWSDSPNTGKAIAVITDAPSLNPSKYKITAEEVGENLQDEGIDLRVLTRAPHDHVTNEVVSAAGGTIETLGYKPSDIEGSLKDIASTLKFYPESRKTITSGSEKGTVTVDYNMNKIGDKFTVYQDGKEIYNKVLSGKGSIDINYSGASKDLEFVVNEGGTSKSDSWTYSAKFPDSCDDCEKKTKVGITSKKVIHDTGFIKAHNLNDESVILNIDGKNRKFRLEGGGLGILPSFMFNKFESSQNLGLALKNLDHVAHKAEFGRMRIATEGNVMNVREEFTNARINLMRSGAEMHQGVNLWKTATEAKTLINRRGAAVGTYKNYSFAERLLADKFSKAA